MRDLLRTAVADAGGMRAYARKIGVSAVYVSDVLRATREPGPKILKPLKISKHVRVVRMVRYERGE